MGLDPRRFRANVRQDKAWLDWLDDEKPLEQVFDKASRNSAAQAQNTSTKPQRPASDTKTIAIHLTVPKLDTTKLSPKRYVSRLPKPSRRQIVGSSLVATVLMVGGAGTLLFNRSKTSDTPQTGVLAEVTERPSYSYVLPNGDESETESKKVAYNAQRQVVSFTDTVGGVQVTVSQQPLPAGFQEDTDTKVEKLAKDFSATDVLSTASPKAYIGTSVDGPQTVIFYKADALVFIKSADTIDKPEWAEYITRLK